ncbi:MAG: hypothetical protein Q9159_003440 [Coniocarpon cinnabarinum]
MPRKRKSSVADLDGEEHNDLRPARKSARVSRKSDGADTLPDSNNTPRKRQSRGSRLSQKRPAAATDGIEANDESDGSSVASEVSSDELNDTTNTPTSTKDVRKGRPTGRRKRSRTPTPPRTLPPHEHYFFQNRPGGTKTSNNTLSSVSLLSHEEYFEVMKNYKDPHRREIEFLHDLHSDSFDQWLFELEEGFNICLYGWGSKRRVLIDFAEHVAESQERWKIVVVNGNVPGTTIRDLLETLSSIVPGLADTKMPANPADALEIILDRLSAPQKHNVQQKYLILIHSLDARSFRRPPNQDLLARLVSHSSISLVATCDTSTFPILWDASLRTHFNWVFHDTTTFAPLDAEIGGVGGAGDENMQQENVVGAGVVEIVNGLLGRSGRKVHGREGVAFVLRSLTESARRLYGLLVAEILSADDDIGGDLEEERLDNEDVDEFGKSPRKSKGRAKQSNAASAGAGNANVEYRTLYRKAVQSLIATSEMQFRQLLKEFYDHEMLVSKKDSMGTELLSLPFRRDELESILEEIEVEN